MNHDVFDKMSKEELLKKLSEYGWMMSEMFEIVEEHDKPGVFKVKQIHKDWVLEDGNKLKDELYILSMKWCLGE